MPPVSSMKSLLSLMSKVTLSQCGSVAGGGGGIGRRYIGGSKLFVYLATPRVTRGQAILPLNDLISPLDLPMPTNRLSLKMIGSVNDEVASSSPLMKHRLTAP